MGGVSGERGGGDFSRWGVSNFLASGGEGDSPNPVQGQKRRAWLNIFFFDAKSNNTHRTATERRLVKNDLSEDQY